jgi:hypothetical protein
VRAGGEGGSDSLLSFVAHTRLCPQLVKTAAVITAAIDKIKVLFMRLFLKINKCEHI